MDVLIWSLAGSAAAGLAVALLLRQRRAKARVAGERASEAADRLKAAFAGAEVTLHDIDRLGLKDAESLLPAHPELPYVIELTVTIRPAEAVEWQPGQLAVVEAEEQDEPDLRLSLLLVSALPLRPQDEQSGPTVGAERLRITVRSRVPGPTFRFEYGGAVFGHISAQGVVVRATRPIPAALRAHAVALHVGEALPPSVLDESPIADGAAALNRGVVGAPPAVAPSDLPLDLLVPPSLRAPTPPPATAILGGSAIAPRRAAAQRPRPPSLSDRPPPPAAPPALFAATPAPWGPASDGQVATVTFEVFGVSAEAFDVPTVEGVDPKGFAPLARRDAPERFSVEALVRDSAEPTSADTRRKLEAAQWMHVVTVRRSVYDLQHLAQALTMAASIAREADGVVRDAVTGRFLSHDQARRILKARRFAVVDHVVIATSASGSGSVVRTRGMVKFAAPELVATDVPKEHVRLVRHALLTLADLASQGHRLAAGQTVQLGPAVVALVPHGPGALSVCDADPLTHASRAGLMGWIDAAVLAG